MGINIKADEVMAGSEALAIHSKEQSKKNISAFVSVENISPTKAKEMLDRNSISEKVLNSLPPGPLALGHFDMSGLEAQITERIRVSNDETYESVIKKIMASIMKMLKIVRNFLFGSETGLHQLNDEEFIGNKENVDTFADKLNELVAGLVSPYEINHLTELNDPQSMLVSFQSNVHAKVSSFVVANSHMKVVSEIFNKRWMPIVNEMGLNKDMSLGQITEFLKNISPEHLNKLDSDGELRACLRHLPQIERNLKSHLESLAVTIAAYAQHDEKTINAKVVENTLIKSGLSIRDVANSANQLRSNVAVDVLRAAAEALQEKDAVSYDASGMDAMLRSVIPPAVEKSAEPSDSTKGKKEAELMEAELDNIANRRHRNEVSSKTDEDSSFSVQPA
ncbi:MAG: hypothetical protein Q7K26_02040 [bacterium]|nr:hypothetical protein [bacterium]